MKEVELSVNFVNAMPNIDASLGYIARVSNPANQDNPNVEKLFAHMMAEGHTSPFTMANVVLEFNAPRDILRQAIRHWSLAVQEFSQRYQKVDMLGGLGLREFRLQDPKNRQASIEVPVDDPRHGEWKNIQMGVAKVAQEAYDWCIANGGAKEVARVVMPEGMTPSRAYFNGNMRSWIFYLKERMKDSTQKEHRELAKQALGVLRCHAPLTMAAFFPELPQAQGTNWHLDGDGKFVSPKDYLLWFTGKVAHDFAAVPEMHHDRIAFTQFNCNSETGVFSMELACSTADSWESVGSALKTSFLAGRGRLTAYSRVLGRLGSFSIEGLLTSVELSQANAFRPLDLT